MSLNFADIYLKFPLEGSFTYQIPENIILKKGRRVKVNFRGQNTIGFVAKIHQNKPEGYKVKKILDLIDQEDIFDQPLIDLAKFVADNYIATIGEVLNLALPSGLKPSARYKIPFKEKTKSTQNFNLTEEQKNIYKDILNFYEQKKIFHLLFGVTGSGKTEIYIELAKYFMAKDRSVIYLVPEISLSSQIFERLYAVFQDQLLIYHSHLTPNQRLHNWLQFYQGKAKIIIGTRSAIFLQPPKLGMVIIDEEHDSSYKEQSSPRYNAKGVAFYRSKKEKALLLMGSATPSFESLFATENNLIKIHHLKNRYNQAKLPPIEIIKINPSNRTSPLSSKLQLYTHQTVTAGEQVIFLLNRRGFSPYVLCDSCGQVITCPHCSISLNYHKNGLLLCHYCGYTTQVPKACPKCNSKKIIKIGIGTQKVEEAINLLFNNFKVFRLDQDSYKKKNFIFDLIKKFNQGEIDIMLGTQMVAKGFDFPKVTLVGILLADIGLNIPDFRASEKIFSLLMQMAGRSGRGPKEGRVVLQTIDNENRLFYHLKKHDYYNFYKEEMQFRKDLFYPPFARIVRLLLRGPEKKKVSEIIKDLEQIIKNIIINQPLKIDLLGPAEAPLGKISNNYRYHLILKSKKIASIREVILIAKKKFKLPKNIYLEIDVDPYDLL